MTASTSIVADARAAAQMLGRHPHDHGWREIYRVIAHAFADSSSALAPVAHEFRALRAFDSDSHFLTLLGIAIRAVAPDILPRLGIDDDLDKRMSILDRAVRHHEAHIRRLVLHRRNSFTSARRFLVPQVLLSAYFAAATAPVRFADLGTGLGILPRELNSAAVFDRFAGDLPWPDGVPRFRPIPLAARFGVDRGPLPDFAWVRACHGVSPYYDRLFDELLLAFELTEPTAAGVRYDEVDLLDGDRLTGFLRGGAIGVANLSYVLYELRPETRLEIIEAALDAMASPGVVVVTEPHDELAGAGCTVTVYGHHHDPLRVLDVSDGHFRGQVRPGPDYDAFLARFRVAFDAGASRP